LAPEAGRAQLRRDDRSTESRGEDHAWYQQQKTHKPSSAASSPDLNAWSVF
jgi:hypothetical protein